MCHAGGRNEDAYAGTVRSVLTTANSSGMQSIAMPLIGNGGAGWPASVAANYTSHYTDHHRTNHKIPQQQSCTLAQGELEVLQQHALPVSSSQLYIAAHVYQVAVSLA